VIGYSSRALARSRPDEPADARYSSSLRQDVDRRSADGGQNNPIRIPNDSAVSLLTTIGARRSLATYAIIPTEGWAWGIRRQNSEVSMARTTIAKRLVFHIGGYDPIPRPPASLHFCRLNCEFIIGNDKRAAYDYFMLVCGPVSVKSRRLLKTARFRCSATTEPLSACRGQQ